MLALVRINLLTHCVERLYNDLLHLGHQVILHTDVEVGVVFINVVLELRERKLVAVLKLSVARAIFLHGIIGKVHECIIDVLEVDAIVSTTSP